MKNCCRRIVLLASVMVALGSASVESSQYGACYIYCSGVQACVQSYTNSYECCSQYYVCPDGNSSSSIVWEPYEGWPMLCGPWAE